MPASALEQPLHLLAPEAALELAGLSRSDSIGERLKKAGIRHFDELIHDQPKEWAL